MTSISGSSTKRRLGAMRIVMRYQRIFNSKYQSELFMGTPCFLEKIAPAAITLAT